MTQREQAIDRFVPVMTRLARQVAGRRGVDPEWIVRLSSEAKLRLDPATMSTVSDLISGLLDEPDETQAPCIPYAGGKCKLASRIVDRMPRHACYCEVFGGTGAVLLAKPRSEYEAWNDLGGYPHALMSVLSDRTRALQLERRLADELASTELLVRRFLSERERARHGRGSKDPVDMALWLLVGVMLWSTPVDAHELYLTGTSVARRRDRYKALAGKLLDLPAIAARMAGVHVYKLDWRQMLASIDSTATVKRWAPSSVLVYLDPPYIAETIEKDFNGHYGDLGVAFTEDDHAAMIEWMRRTRARVMLSGKRSDHPLVRELERDSRVVRHDLPMHGRGGHTIAEAVWCNFTT